MGVEYPHFFLFLKIPLDMSDTYCIIEIKPITYFREDENANSH